MKFLKRFFLGLFITVFLLVALVLVLVRFTDLTISQSQKALLGYNEETKKWALNKWEKRILKGWDGPYVFRSGDQYEVIQVMRKEEGAYLKHKEGKLDAFDSLKVIVDNLDEDSFYVKLTSAYLPQPTIIPQTGKIVAISDIEGNFNAFQGFLEAHQVIDKNLKWRFGDGHLVLVGDFMDRGRNVTQVLWLIYKLEQEAALAGGGVHFVLGNHEALNLQKRYRYVHQKYIAIAQELSGEQDYKSAYASLMAENNELVNWLKSKNLVLKIGDNLFVHAGISPALANSGLTLEEINQIGKRTITERLYNATDGDPEANLIAGRQGPLWFRGMVMDYKEHYQKITDADLQQILATFDVSRIILGHTVVDEVSSDFEGKVVRIDVKHGKEKKSDQTQGILISGEKIFKLDALGSQLPF